MMSVAVWLARVLSGAMFIVSGWAKCVDPWGFVYKIEDYLAVWGLQHVIPVDVVLVGAVGLSVIELMLGVSLACGLLRRAAPVGALGLMAFMLPLTIYIYVADPVADCGCFGDLLVVSNGITLLKNIVLTALLVFVLWRHGSAGSLVRPSLQWMALAVTGIYGLTIAFIGWNFQPIVDFRPFPPGATLAAATEEEAVPTYVYERDGQREQFALDALPDSSWTFVSAVEQPVEEGTPAFFDGDYEVTAEVLDYDGEQLLMIVNNPGNDYLTRARLARQLADAMARRGGRLVALVAASGDVLEQWMSLARPDFDVYSSADTQLKQLARGNTAIVAMRDGRILWKRSLATLDPAVASAADPIDAVTPVDDGSLACRLSLGWLAAMLLLIAISRLYSRRNKNKAADVKKS